VWQGDSVHNIRTNILTLALTLLPSCLNETSYSL
jgi:hypothetical protein